MTPAKDLGQLLEGIPAGAWVAISHDEERVVAFSAELKDAIEKAKKAGEDLPRIIRVPQFPSSLLV